MRYILAYGLPGYGPDASDDNFSVATTWRDVADIVREMLTESAEQAGDSAASTANAGDYEAAWKTREHAEEMFNLAETFNNKRSDAPLYRGDATAWDAEIERLVGEHFPYDVDPGCRLYVWESEEFGIDDEDLLGADLTRAEWREVVSKLNTIGPSPALSMIAENILSQTGPLGEAG